MKILLVNPNQYKSPPVPPIGLEHVAAELEKGGHEVRLLDLCFSIDPVGDLDKTVHEFKPDAAGFTIRNVDTVLYHTNEFFLDEIRELIRHVKSRFDLEVIIGGTGVSTNPEGVLNYLGADAVICGPAEDMACEAIESMMLSESSRRIFRRRYNYDITCGRKSGLIDYKAYISDGGIAGFETHKGCTSSCIYCLEANTPVSVKPNSNVISEIKALKDRGVSKFHLCDPEFNEDADHAMDFCEALKKSGLNIDWALYMKPANYSKRLIRLMKESGVGLITLTVDSWKKCPLYWDDVEKIIFSSKSQGIKIAVDFLTGFPYEDDNVLKFYLDLFRRIQPDSVGINTYIRLYRTLSVTKMVLNDPALAKNVTGQIDDPQMIRPVFFNCIPDDKVLDQIRGEEMFRLEGTERRVNYSRVVNTD